MDILTTTAVNDGLVAVISQLKILVASLKALNLGLLSWYSQIIMGPLYSCLRGRVG
jgi:hypothetical protein